jgi:uncharacterized membrane protein
MMAKDGPAKTQRFGIGPRSLYRQDPKTGEWQRVLSGGNRHGPLLDQRPREQRVQEELEGIKERRQLMAKHALAMILGFAAVVGMIVYYVDVLSPRTSSDPDAGMNFFMGYFIYILFGLGLVGFALLMMRDLAKALGVEFLYRIGIQHWIKGAKVLDPEPVRPGRGVVENQKVHGDARLASEAEARAAAKRGGRRSSVHDQEF